MGAHASQLSKEERWTVVYHVQKLQGIELGNETVDSTVVAEPVVADVIIEDAHVTPPTH